MSDPYPLMNEHPMSEQRQKKMEETFALSRCWSPQSSPREQVWSQRHAEEEFDRYVEQMKQAGAEVSPVTRFMRTSKDEDGRDWMTFYTQKVYVKASERVIYQLKQRFGCKDEE